MGGKGQTPSGLIAIGLLTPEPKWVTMPWGWDWEGDRKPPSELFIPLDNSVQLSPTYRPRQGSPGGFYAFVNCKRFILPVNLDSRTICNICKVTGSGAMSRPRQ